MATKVVSNELFFLEVRRVLSSGKSTIIPVKGNSMLPFIRDRKSGSDSVELVVKESYNVGDIVLGEYKSGCYVLHRIISIDGDKITLMGDGNIAGVEYLKKENIYGAVSKVIRKSRINGGRERIIEVDSPGFVRCSKLWRVLKPFRRYILAIYRRII